MEIVVELDGVSSAEVGCAKVRISVEPEATGHDVLRALVKASPRLARTMIDVAKAELLDKTSWLAYENRMGIPDLSVPLCLTEGARLLVLSDVC